MSKHFNSVGPTIDEMQRANDAANVTSDDNEETPHAVGSQKTLSRAGFPTIRKGESVTVKEHVPLKSKQPGVKWAKIKGTTNTTHRYRVENAGGKSAWAEHGDLE